MIYFVLTRYLFDPMAWVFYLLVAALIAGHYRREGLQRGLVAGAAIFLLGLMFLPVDETLARPLENRYPRPTLPAHVDGIVVLGGGLNAGVFASRGVTGENWSVLRLIAGADLARRFPNAKFVFSGLAGATRREKEFERNATLNLVAALGVPPTRVIFERTSRDTGENLADSMAMVHPKAGETWMLVTSAIHMPRAMAIAKRLGWNMQPWPSDYISTATARSAVKIEFPSDQLVNIDRALHEWIGMLIYALTGRA